MKQFKYLLVTGLFIGAVTMAYSYQIEKHAQQKTLDLTAIPEEIGEWSMLKQEAGVGEFEATFLNNVLIRTYKRADGKAVMLAVAYGADQKQKFSIHAPEGCYRASGFDVTTLGTVVDPSGIELRRLLARNKEKMESVQYWIIIDGTVVTNHFQRKFKQIYYSLIGAQADGVLVRVSSLSNDRTFEQDYEIQRSFISELYSSLNSELQKLFFGEEKI